MKKTLMTFALLSMLSFAYSQQNPHYETITLDNPNNVSGAGGKIHFASFGDGSSSFGPQIKSSLYFAFNALSKSSLTLSSYWEGYKDELTLANGNVGVATPSPQHTLDVNGDFRVKNNNNHFFYDGAGDLQLTYLARGTGGRAIVHDINNTLSLNHNNDFTGGTRIGNTFLVKDDNASLQGKFEAKEIKVTLTPTADFVFAENYDLPKLEDVEKHIKDKKHLPEVASAKQMEKEGVNVGEFQIKLLQKIEELTLYTIEQNKQLKIQKEEIELLKKQMSINNQQNR